MSKILISLRSLLDPAVEGDPYVGRARFRRTMRIREDREPKTPLFKKFAFR